VAVDLPTGVSSDEGVASPDAIRADVTVTFGHPRRGHWLWPGRGLRGELEVADIGLLAPERASLSPAELATRDVLARLLPRRDPRAHKGSAGRVLLVGGAPGMTGAVVLAARAAARSGAGYVRVAAPASLQDTLAAHLVEPRVIACGEDDRRSLTTTALPVVLAEAEQADAVAVGSGLSRRPLAAALARELATRLPRPLVLDADALTALSPAGDVLVPALKLATAPRVLTPHLGEMRRLTGIDARLLDSDRIDAAREWARRWHSVVVLKGAPTVIAGPDGSTTVNPTGNPGMATAGMGDVLAGVIAALIAQGLAPYDAARLGAYVHGSAGDRVAAERGQHGLVAGDLAEALPQTLLALARLRTDAAGAAAKPGRQAPSASRAPSGSPRVG
jgi:NAD(P)H-hydrate epimerase